MSLECAECERDLRGEVLAMKQPLPAPPKISGIYFLISGDAIIYVGQSRNVLERVNRHELRRFCDSFAYMECDEALAATLERRYIEFLKPIFNAVHNPERKFGNLYRRLATHVDETVASDI